MLNKSVFKVTYTAFFTALTVLAISVIKFSTGFGEGYIHFGDSVIYITACVLPFPYCIISAVLGGALADILSGFAVWVISTAIIKALTVIPFAIISKRSSSVKILNKATALMTAVSGIITIFGYFTAECFLYSLESAMLSTVGNLIQAVASGIIFCIIAAALDKFKFKQQILKGVK